MVVGCLFCLFLVCFVSRSIYARTTSDKRELQLRDEPLKFFDPPVNLKQMSANVSGRTTRQKHVNNGKERTCEQWKEAFP